MLRIPSGSKTSRRSCLIKTPKEARTPKAEGCSSFRALTVERSSFVLAWKRIWRPADLRTEREVSASGPLPKKMISGRSRGLRFLVGGLVIFAPEFRVVEDF